MWRRRLLDGWPRRHPAPLEPQATPPCAAEASNLFTGWRWSLGRAHSNLLGEYEFSFVATSSCAAGDSGARRARTQTPSFAGPHTYSQAQTPARARTRTSSRRPPARSYTDTCSLSRPPARPQQHRHVLSLARPPARPQLHRHVLALAPARPPAATQTRALSHARPPARSHTDTCSLARPPARPQLHRHVLSRPRPLAGTQLLRTCTDAPPGKSKIGRGTHAHARQRAPVQTRSGRELLQSVELGLRATAVDLSPDEGVVAVRRYGSMHEGGREGRGRCGGGGGVIK